jgi:hypothetical protein
MDKFRNFIEYGIAMNMTKISMCQQDDLTNRLIKEEFTEEFPCHIYFIISRPRIAIIPEKCEFNDLIKLVFRVQNGFSFEEKIIFLKPIEETTNYRIESEFPHSKFYMFNGNKQILYAKSALYYAMHSREYAEEFNSELLYIGQSYGKEGERDSTSRLKNHSTLQKIYSEAIQNNPDKEIWLNLLSFTRELHTSFDGTNKLNRRHKNEVENASKIMSKFVKNELNEKEIINFTEASLIKYFKPKYNIMFKDIFPSIDHKSYQECIELDVNSVGFQLDTDCINTKLFTEHIKPSFLNMASFTLKSKENRRNLFDIIDTSLVPNTFGNIKIE